MDRQLEWNIEGDGRAAKVVLIGQINEESRLEDLLVALDSFDRITLDLEKISRVNSIGVREWVNFARGIPGHKQVVLAKCSPAIVAQLNMIRNFANGAAVESLCAPYVCDACGHETTVVIQTPKQKMPELKQVFCGACGSQMEIDDFTHSYFSFLDP